MVWYAKRIHLIQLRSFFPHSLIWLAVSRTRGGTTPVPHKQPFTKNISLTSAVASGLLCSPPPPSLKHPPPRPGHMTTILKKTPHSCQASPASMTCTARYPPTHTHTHTHTSTTHRPTTDEGPEEPSRMMTQRHSWLSPSPGGAGD